MTLPATTRPSRPNPLRPRPAMPVVPISRVRPTPENPVETASKTIKAARSRADRAQKALRESLTRETSVSGVVVADDGNPPLTAPHPTREALVHVMRIVGKIAGVTVEEVRSAHRGHKYVAARNAAIRLSAQLWPQLSLSQLGRVYNRDHSTILYVLNGHSKNTALVERADEIFAAAAAQIAAAVEAHLQQAKGDS